MDQVKTDRMGEAEMNTAEAARGRWPEILQALDIAIPAKHGPCPADGQGEDRFRFANNDGTGSFFCQCSEGDKGGIALVMCCKGWSFAEAAGEVDKIIGRTMEKTEPPKPTYAQQLRNAAITSPRSKYLEGRGLKVPPGIQFHRGVRHSREDRTLYAAMLAPIYHRGKFLTYHVTYLDGGQKANVKPCRKILPGPANEGGACPLWPAAEKMGVAEGVESAIAAAMLHRMPVWAALNTALLAKFDPPPECKELIIFGDHDANYAGQAAAFTLAKRVYGKVEHVDVALPTMPGIDWNDILLRGEK